MSAPGHRPSKPESRERVMEVTPSELMDFVKNRMRGIECHGESAVSVLAVL